FGPSDPNERPYQHVVDLLGEEEAEDEGYAEAEQRLDQPRTQLDQMVHQRRFAGLDVFGAHDALASLATSGVAGAVSCGASGPWTSCVIASGCEASACASASLKVSGIGISGVVGMTGALISEVAGASAAGASICDVAGVSVA